MVFPQRFYFSNYGYMNGFEKSLAHLVIFFVKNTIDIKIVW